MARGDSGTATEDDTDWEWDWTMVELSIMMGIILIASIPYFYSMWKNPPIDNRRGSGRKND